MKAKKDPHTPNDVRRELLKAVRGKRSQLALSRRLGFDFNQVYRWESGHTQLQWSDFARLCKLCRADLAAALKVSAGYRDDPAESAQLCRFILGTNNISLASQAIGVSRFKIMKWLKGVSEPNLDWVLSLFNQRDMLLEFVNTLVDIAEVKSLTADYKTRQLQLNLFYSEPMTAAVFLAIELGKYRKVSEHKPGVIGGLVGVDIAEENRLLQLLRGAEVIKFTSGKYVRDRNFRSSRGGFEGEKLVRRFWMERGLARDQARPAPDTSRFGCMLLALGEENFAKVEKAFEEFASAIAKIAQTTAAGEVQRIRVMNVQFFDIKPS